MLHRFGETHADSRIGTSRQQSVIATMFGRGKSVTTNDDSTVSHNYFELKIVCKNRYIKQFVTIFGYTISDTLSIPLAREVASFPKPI